MSNVPAQTAPIGTTNTTSVQNYYNLAGEYSLSEIDTPQDFIANVVAELPFGRGRRFLSNAHGFEEKLLGGWNASGILVEQSGVPLALSAVITGGGNRPNYVAGVSPKLASSRPLQARVGEWFNTAAFSSPPAFTFGDVSRTIGSVRSPAVHNLDFVLDKETQLTERLHMQFRAEAFNLTNTTHFGLPDTSLNSATFGQLTSVLPSPPPRQIQFAVKLSF
jgi:hypothetical protein